ncbi:hypothetical protein [Streptomyces sp. BP-8]|uniref:ATP-binding protein n=1 Tax=Streptomyces sirii TaxID=3127701 RepID=A0ABZ2QK75_9ACTN
MKRTRLAASTGALATVLVLFGGPAAVADDGPLLKSKNQAGVSVGSLLDIGAKTVTTTGGSTTDTKINTAGVNLDTDADVDLDLAASLLASLG